MLQDDNRFLPKQILQIAQFFSTGLFAHSKLYNFLFTQPQAHDEQNVTLQVVGHQSLRRLASRCCQLICGLLLHSKDNHI